MTASTAEASGILGLTPDATLADVKKAYANSPASTTPTAITPIPGPSTGPAHHRSLRIPR